MPSRSGIELFGTQRSCWVDPHGRDRGGQRGHEGGREQKGEGYGDHRRIGGSYREQERRDEALRRESGGDSSECTGGENSEDLRSYATCDMPRARPERHADADFPGPPHHGAAQHAVQSDAGQDERESRKEYGELREQPFADG